MTTAARWAFLTAHGTSVAWTWSLVAGDAGRVRVMGRIRRALRPASPRAHPKPF